MMIDLHLQTHRLISYFPKSMHVSRPVHVLIICKMGAFSHDYEAIAICVMYLMTLSHYKLPLSCVMIIVMDSEALPKLFVAMQV